MSLYKHEMGAQVRDLITGFKGTITGRGDYITGCRQYLVQPPVKDGDFKRGQWFDEDRLVLDETATPVDLPEKVENPGGPQDNCAPVK